MAGQPSMWALGAALSVTMVLAASLLACTTRISPEDTQRIAVLYTHTQIMIDLTSPDDAQAIGLDISSFAATDDPLQRLAALEAALGLSPGRRTIPERITAAEARMADMMAQWQELQET